MSQGVKGHPRAEVMSMHHNGASRGAEKWGQSGEEKTKISSF